MTNGQLGVLRARTSNAIKRAGRRLLSSRIATPILRRRALKGDPITVLVYHTLGADNEEMDAWTVLKAGDFARQIAFLREQYEIITLDEAVAGEPSTTGRPRAVITFDDGDVGLYTHLLPILDRMQVPATVYVATRQIATGRPYWFDRTINAVQTRTPVTIDLSAEGVGKWTVAGRSGSENWQGISAILEALKQTDPERRERAVDAVVAQTSDSDRRDVTPLNPLTLLQLQELAASPWVTIAAHTDCHSLLDQLSLDAALDSVETSRQRLREWTGAVADHFAYPNGNHTEALARGIEALGFRSASIVGNRLWDGKSDKFKMPRIPIGRYDDLARFKLRLSGI